MVNMYTMCVQVGCVECLDLVYFRVFYLDGDDVVIDDDVRMEKPLRN